MNVNEDIEPRGGRQAARSAATRAKLVGAARRLFAARGFAAVGTEEIVRAAGVTRGALYHHFRDKEALFAAVYEEVERELAEDMSARALATMAERGPWAALELGADLWLDASASEEVQRIVLLDGPAVLGWEAWREIAERYGVGLVEAVLQAAIDAGELEPAPVRPLALVLLAALDELALFLARSPDQEEARAQAGVVLERVLRALRA
jgi:AcrR family transcriptional regulator